MTHPTLTILFDLFLIGSAAAVIASMVKEYLDGRVPAIGSHRTPQSSMARSVSAGSVPPRQVGSRSRSSFAIRPQSARKHSSLRTVAGPRGMAQVI